MKKTETRTEEVQVLTEVICDCCGKSCRVKGFTEEDYQFVFMEIEQHWGFFSDKDLEKWTAQICEPCVNEKMGFINFQKSVYPHNK